MLENLFKDAHKISYAQRQEFEKIWVRPTIRESLTEIRSNNST